VHTNLKVLVFNPPSFFVVHEGTARRMPVVGIRQKA
jgi:hypothetical protein